MTMKKIAFDIQSDLSKAHGIQIKRSHIRELIAALFGFTSWAAMHSQRVLGQYTGPSPIERQDIAGAASRALNLGYRTPMPPIIATEIARAAEAARLCPFAFEQVLPERDVGHDDEASKGFVAGYGSYGSHDFDDDIDNEESGYGLGQSTSIDWSSTVLKESLNRIADSGDASVHLLLAELDDDELEDYASDDVNDGRYWFEQQRAGRALTGVELEWAHKYRHKQNLLCSRERHIQQATILGSIEAAVRRAEDKFDDETFELAARVAGDLYPDRLGNLAIQLGRDDDARTWLRLAAERGDTDAMRTLAETLEPNLKDAWTWVYLAKLLGVDLMAYHAVDEYGQVADADEAGPIYAAGGFELAHLAYQDNTSALEAARAMHERLIEDT